MNSFMKKVLILGAKGGLGRQLSKVYAADNSFEVIAWDRGDIDITDKELIQRKIEEIKPVIILNSTGYNAVDKCENDDAEFESAKKLNGEAVGYLADAALKIGAVIVNFASDYVFDGENIDGYRENDETKPISNYGISKVMGERELISRSGKGLKWYQIRTSKLFGPVAESDGAKPSFFDLILNLSRERKEFNMVDGEEISFFTYTPDLAVATKRLIESDKGYGIYHITNSGAASWYEAAKYLFELKGITDVKLNAVSSNEYPRPARRPKYSKLLDTKFERPLRNWKDALKEHLGI